MHPTSDKSSCHGSRSNGGVDRCGVSLPSIPIAHRHQRETIPLYNRRLTAEEWLLQIARLLLRVDMPDNVVGQTLDLVTSAQGHLAKAFGLGLILEGVAGKVDTL